MAAVVDTRALDNLLRLLQRDKPWWLKSHELLRAFVQKDLQGPYDSFVIHAGVSSYQSLDWRSESHSFRLPLHAPEGMIIDLVRRAYEEVLAKLAPPLPTEDLELASMALNSEEGLKVFADHLLAQGRIAAYPTAWFLDEGLRAKLAQESILEAAGKTARNILGPHIFAGWTIRWYVVDRLLQRMHAAQSVSLTAGQAGEVLVWLDGLPNWRSGTSS